MRKLDLTGQRFGRLTVIKEAGRTKQNRIKWLCQCDCGRQITVARDNLVNEHQKSCGCLRKNMAIERNVSHKKRYTRLYTTWKNMKQRCSNPAATKYDRYGGRGITVCDEWREDFQTFYDWAMANGYSDDLTIDRIDNDGDYEPSNCQWITQAENTRKARNDKK